MDFVHLHLHTQYSVLDGAIKIKDTTVAKQIGDETKYEVKAKGLMSRVKDLGQKAVAMTDHGVMSGVIEFTETAKKCGIHPIIGCEVYVAQGSRFDKQFSKGKKSAYHLTLLAQNEIGFKNLSHLSSRAYIEGFYFKPRIDFELLSELSEGIICLSGCLSSELSSYALAGDIERARELVKKYVIKFGDRYYLEIQPHVAQEQQRANQMALELSKEFGVPLVATNDCHYLDQEDKFAQEVLMCVSMKKLLTDENRIKHDGFELHLKSAEEMLEGLPGLEVALENTVKIAERCELEVKKKKPYYMPQYTPPAGMAVDDYFVEAARKGLEFRIKQFAERRRPLTPAEIETYKARLETEIAVIKQMKFPGYFLVVSDFINWAKEHHIPVGPGRGSGAGSLVAYAMRITEINPIDYDLLFERFLNPERVSLPDFDVDFCIRGRDDVIKYVCEKYGKDKVTQICTFGTLKAKAAIKDVGRVLGISYAETDKIAKLIPTPQNGKDCPLTDALEKEPRLKEYANGEYKRLIELALKLETLVRNVGTHAAGVVLADETIMDIAPLLMVRDTDGTEKIATQYPMAAVEAAGLVKFDFLGLKTLTVIDDAVRMIAEKTGKNLDLNALLLSKGQNAKANQEIDKVYSLIASGKTVGVFQLESAGITEMVMRMKPDCFDDLIAILALYRPGPLNKNMDDRYILRKHGEEKVEYDHPCLEPILKNTFGGMIYQEQIIQIAQIMAGYTLGGADLLRRAMGKKKKEEMIKERSKFLEGAVKKGIKLEIAKKVFADMESFADYGFNKSHSAAYALITYQTAYLKTFYPAYFMAALMSHEMGDTDKTLKNFNECNRLGITIMSPNINTQFADFTVEPVGNRDRILFGLAGIKGIGHKAVREIVVERSRNGEFKGLLDFCKRLPDTLNTRQLENFIKAGAFDWTNLSRAELNSRVEEALKLGQTVKKDLISSQFGLFDGELKVDDDKNYRPNKKLLAEWTSNIKLGYEKEVLGFYLSGHPLERFKEQLDRIGAKSINDVKEYGTGIVTVAGVVSMLVEKNNKKGERYATFMLEDLEGTIKVNVWSRTYKEYFSIFTSDEPVIVTGRLDVSDERVQLTANTIESVITSRNKVLREVEIVLDSRRCKHLPELQRILAQYQGDLPVKLLYRCAEHSEILIALGAEIKVSASQEFSNAVEHLLGEHAVVFR
ncbi:MAG: DNA polymerase III subunit alpha [Deltaproteobacteria bacterium]|jgi:DNA polymerase-3 subunit alpha|nr:DNA polymerase III subunit alpha [Deltaproteobacteria bacterium]